MKLFLSSRRLFRCSLLVPLVCLAFVFLGLEAAEERKEGKETALAAVAVAPLRVLCFGGHPDDCELQAGATAAMWAAAGHKVKFVSVTNGDIGHWRDAGGPLARRRKGEVMECAKILGVESEVLDIHDGELEPTLENRRKFTRLIREWKADVVIGHRPNDYHPDHRYTGILMQDSAYMVTVPHFCPDVEALQKNPVLMYFPDRFQKPNPFKPDVVVDVTPAMERKLDALGKLVSQFAEGGANGNAKLMPPDADAEGQKRRHAEVRTNMAKRNEALAERFRAQLIETYGQEKGGKVRYAEAFELCEYGAQPDKKELQRLFPF